MAPPHPPTISSPSQPSIWKQMSYTPPRGPCAHKPTLLTPTCACLRFMIHPLKATSSFDCDGCGHHASFHRMENRAEEGVVERWRTRDGEGEGDVEKREEGRARKVRRIGGAGTGVGGKRKLLTAGERGGAGDGDRRGMGQETDTVGEEDDGGEGVRARRGWGG